MADIEKAIRILEGSYKNFVLRHNGELITVNELLALLKAQEPVEPILKREGWNKYHNDYVCPVCDQELVYEQNYCSECGRAVKWE